jgi:hypothetical protein
MLSRPGKQCEGPARHASATRLFPWVGGVEQRHGGAVRGQSAGQEAPGGTRADYPDSHGPLTAARSSSGPTTAVPSFPTATPAA